MDWRHWLIGDDSNSSLPSNISDLFDASCVGGRFETLACCRAGLLSLLGTTTAVLCAFRLCRLHRPRSPPCHHLVLFYTLFLHAIIGSVESVLGWTTQAALFSAYLRSIELLTLCHFYLMITSRLSHWTEAITSRLSVLLLTALFCYFTVFVVVGLAFAVEPGRDCRAPYWLWLSGGNFLSTQLIAIAFIIIDRRITIASTADHSKRIRHRARLIGLFSALETAALADLAWHIGILLLSDASGCGAVFHHRQVVYSSAKMLYELLAFFLPTWALLAIFRIHDQPPVEMSERTTSGGSGTLPTVVVVRNWRRRYRPLGGTQSASGFVGSFRHRRRTRSAHGAESGSARVVPRVASAPMLAAVRGAGGSSVASSPLYAIQEMPSPPNSSNSSSTSNLSTVPLLSTSLE